MNAPLTQSQILRKHVAAIEARYPLVILGKLPRGEAAHVFSDDALDLLAEKRPGLTYFDVAGAEIELSGLVGREVGIVLVSEYPSKQAFSAREIVMPL
jgi:predicted nucleotidyltransferase